MNRVIPYLVGTMTGAVLFVLTLVCFDALGLDFSAQGTLRKFGMAVGLVLLHAFALTVFTYRIGLREGYLRALEDSLDNPTPNLEP